MLAEAFHLAGPRGYPARLLAMVDQQIFRVDFGAPWPSLARASLAWMRRYEDHAPDFTDAFLVAWYEAERGARVWTFDSELRAVWRTSKGKAIKLVTST